MGQQGKVVKEMDFFLSVFVFSFLLINHVLVEPWRRLSTEELMLLNCGAG